MDLTGNQVYLGFKAEVWSNGRVYITLHGKEFCLARDSASARDILVAYEVGYNNGRNEE